jgi:glucose-1-phosphate thymidylyltransferase|tara:strand:- start:1312 stop:2163 length:852 start_codon:yes stop_codon:yes gene_type:complete
MNKGIILSGGTGSRLFPLTTIVNKQLLHVYDKPMVYYPLSTLIRKGIRDICIISSPSYIQHYLRLFINSSQLGLNIEFRAQITPKGIPEALTISEDFIGKDSCCLILGDNIFHGAQRYTIPEEGAMIFGYPVKHPSRYGVVEFNSKGNAISIEEKPEKPKSKYAIPGIYFLDNKSIKYAKELNPSERGELEITDLIKRYLEEDALKVTKLNRGFVWLDAGLPSTLHQASSYIQTIQERQDVSIGCIEEDCYRAGFIDKKQLRKIVETYPDSEYRLYLERVLSE